jgi:TonB family protein
METLAARESASLNTAPELHLLLEHDRDDDWRRWRASGVASVIAHLVLIGGLLVLPAGPIIGLVFLLWISAWVIERDRAYDWRQWQSSAVVSVAAHLILIAGLLLLPASAIIGLVFLGWIGGWLRERDRAYDWGRWRTPGAISAAVHIVLIATLLLMPESMTSLRVYESKAVPVVTPLYFPTELTQNAPNKGKISKELSVEAATPTPVLKSPSPPPPAKKVPAAAPPPPQIARTEPKLVIVEPPKIEAPATPQPEQIAKLASPVPPPPPPAQPPKLQLENAITPPTATQPGNPQGNPQARIAMPNNSIDASIRDITRGTVPTTQSVEDVGEVSSSNGFGVNLPPSAGRQQSSMELASDPMGADFRPYMRQILQTIKRNWLAVYPEAARQGTRGEVVLLFRIVKDGTVAKVSFSTESGAKALDQAAVAAISASNPLLPLPREFKGNQIVLRMTFKYNMQR